MWQKSAMTTTASSSHLSTWQLAKTRTRGDDDDGDGGGDGR